MDIVFLKMKVERDADTFYNKEINEFAKKKRSIELIYKFSGFIIFSLKQ